MLFGQKFLKLVIMILVINFYRCLFKEYYL